jgi:hypothetical protein
MNTILGIVFGFFFACPFSDGQRRVHQTQRGGYRRSPAGA